MTKGWVIAATLGYLAFEYVSDKIKEAKEKKAKEAAKKVEKNFTPPAVIKDPSISTKSKILESYLVIENDFLNFLSQLSARDIKRGYAVANLPSKTFNYLFETDKGAKFRVDLINKGIHIVPMYVPGFSFGEHLIGIGINDHIVTLAEGRRLVQKRHPRTNGMWLSSSDPFAPDGKAYYFLGDTDQFYFDD